MTTATARNWIRVNKRNPCPICGKLDWCVISQNGKATVCARIESDKPAGNKGAGWLHKLDTTKTLPPHDPRPDAKQTPKATPDALDRAYRALLEGVLTTRLSPAIMRL